MRAVFGLVLIVGLGLAGFAVYMAQGFFEEQQVALEQERAAAARIVPTVDVLAMTRAIDYGESIRPDDVKVIKYVEASLPEGVFHSIEEFFAEGDNDDELRVVLRPMEENEPLMAVKMTEPGGNAGITSRLAPGMRAFTINVDVTSGVSGFLRPGDRVDVYWTGRSTNSNTDITKLIETAMEIIAVDQNSDDTRNSAMIARTVTVQATPTEVAALAQAQSTGRLSLALVGAEDTTTAGAIEIDQNELLGIEEQVVVEEVAPVEQVCTIRTRRGAEVVEIPIPCTN